MPTSSFLKMLRGKRCFYSDRKRGHIVTFLLICLVPGGLQDENSTVSSTLSTSTIENISGNEDPSVNTTPSSLAKKNISGNEDPSVNTTPSFLAKTTDYVSTSTYNSTFSYSASDQSTFTTISPPTSLQTTTMNTTGETQSSTVNKETSATTTTPTNGTSGTSPTRSNFDMYLVLAVGVMLFIAGAILVIVYTVKLHRLRLKIQEEANGKSKRDKRRHKDHDTADKDSLISVQHNYEEVSEDGISGGLEARSKERKQSRSSAAQPFQHNSGMQEETSISIKEDKRNTMPNIIVTTENDYNKLDFVHSQRTTSGAVDSKQEAHQQKSLTTVVEGDYMEVDIQDIYEHVEEDKKVDNSRQQKDSDPEDLYANCPTGMSSEPNLSQTSGPIPESDAGRKSFPKQLPPRAPTEPKHSKSDEYIVNQNMQAQRPHPGHKQSRSLDRFLADPYYVNTHSLEAQTLSRSTTNLLKASTNGAVAHGFHEKESNHSSWNSTDSASGFIATSQGKINAVNQSLESLESNGTPKKKTGADDEVVYRAKSKAAKPAYPVMLMMDHLKATNPDLLLFKESVRQSMELNEDELVLIDNILYDALPRDTSLPTTEL